MEMHVLTPSLSLRHEGLLNQPPNHRPMAIAKPSKESKAGGKVLQPAAHGDDGLLQLHCVCVGIWA